ncbi:hypothetical protein KIH41_12705 [Litoribacter ruber]|uniref:Uncharacterized protein n=1 Tax=Litoribacter ruber TaxID=702568 RepID=A0AAP2CFI1_9BACT|nr:MULTISPECIES: hypothetical protein [Litoribacter]MBS9523623.1 hypothetical protein [Litoribacter alkaliphilus]MBT0812137.1 hypothetical protein [Litoribacter ruber]
MNTKFHTYIHTLSFVLVVSIAVWATVMGTLQTKDLLTYLILVVAFLEAFSLWAGRKIHSEAHTSYKLGLLASLMILLGIKSMLPAFFPTLTVTVLSINFVYNFYISNKRVRRVQPRAKKRLKFK